MNSKFIYTLLLFVIEISKQIELTCDEAIKNLTKYSCVPPSDPEYFININNKRNIYTVSSHNKDELYLMTVRKTISKIEKENTDIYYLKLAQEATKTLKLVDTNIMDDYTYIITEKPYFGNLNDFIKKTDYLDNRSNIFNVLKEVLLFLSHIHFKGIVHSNISYDTVYVRKDYSIAVGGFEKAVAYNSFHSKSELVEYSDPYIDLSTNNDKIHFSEKIDVWSIGELLYFILHRKNIKIDLLPLSDSTNILAHMVRLEKAIDIDFIEIMNACLKIRPLQRISMLNLHQMVADFAKHKTREISKNKFYINLDEQLPQNLSSVLEKFSELIFILFLVFLVIPLTVMLISKKIKDDEEQIVLDHGNEQINNR